MAYYLQFLFHLYSIFRNVNTVTIQNYLNGFCETRKNSKKEKDVDK